MSRSWRSGGAWGRTGTAGPNSPGAAAPAPDARVPLPWLAQLTEEQLGIVLDPDTVARGTAYWRSGAVTALAARDGRVLVATVRGSGGRTYSTLVQGYAATDGRGRPLPPDWDSRCSCPMQVDCKTSSR